jgi:ABC-type transporter Mla subunit MlaD
MTPAFVIEVRHVISAPGFEALPNLLKALETFMAQADQVSQALAAAAAANTATNARLDAILGDVTGLVDKVNTLTDLIAAQSGSVPDEILVQAQALAEAAQTTLAKATVVDETVPPETAPAG